MPKKKATKGKKGKAGKGKKEGKQEAKVDKESDVEKAKASAALWQARLDANEQSRVQYREACRRLGRINEELTSQQHRAERDTIDILGLLRKKDAQKEEEIKRLEEQLRSQMALAREEQKKLVEEYTVQINKLEERFKERSDEFNMIQEEWRKIREFQKREAQMEQELITMRESMRLADKEHRENLNRMECKFFGEKVRLEKEAEQRIALLAESAHSEAIVQLDDASRCVFKDNVRLNEALNYHIKEAQDLQKLTTSLVEEKASLALNKETGEMMIKKNAVQMKAQRKEISELKAKVATLEQALETMVMECEQEKEDTQQQVLVSSQASQVELERLQKELAVQEKETGRVKRLAGCVVRQRTELEQFFHEALFQVKQEIQASRLHYKEEALQAYRRRMSAATARKLKFPLIRTFTKNPHSTNCVYSDMGEAEKWNHLRGNKVDISDLTWEQKEKVLRLLFAKMNGQKARNLGQHLALAASFEKNHSDTDAAGITEELSPVTFITQAPVSNLPSNPNRLPDIHTT